MGGYRLAVDYGTSNTVAMLATPDGRVRPLLFDGAPLLPSAVYAQPDGIVLTGRDAQNSARLDPARFEPNPKRRIDDVEILLGEHSWPVVELAARTLARVATEAARTAGGPPAELVMTCPVTWGPVRRDVLTRAAARAGLPRPTLVPEPVAAAAYYTSVLGQEVLGGRSVVVYDLGGGTFDVCVVRREDTGFHALAYRGIDDFGGMDLDALVVAQLAQAVAPGAPEAWRRLSHPADAADRRHFRALWDDARTAKEALSRQSHATVFVPVVERDAHVSREAFEQAASGALRRTIDVTLATLREAQTGPADIAGLFLVGGSTRVPMVATLLHRATGIAPTLLEQPETVVAEGALRAVPGVMSAAPAPSRPTTPPPGRSPAVGLGAPGPGTARGVASPVPPGTAPPVSRPVPSPPRPSANPLTGPVLGAVMLALGMLTLLVTPNAATHERWLFLGCAVGSALFCAGGVLSWFWRGLPLLARFGVPAVHLLLTVYWFTKIWDLALALKLSPSFVGAPAWILAGVTTVLFLLTAATLGVRRREPAVGRPR
ncbi:Hsp70 family protein [Longispora sp. NPDC051575]|uniref:Hsp70 family protein n=1 Tax=Longispora sp. NPDC051575 TaxID=3154943 RepID=UPI0034357FC6